MQRQEMSVDFEMTEVDVVAFHRHQFKTSPQHRKNFWIGLLSFPSLIFVLTFIYSDFSIAATLRFALPVTVIFLPLVYFVQYKSINNTGKRMRALGKNEGVFCRHTISISPDGVHEKTKVNDSQSGWRGIEKVDETDNHVFVYIASNNAHVVPKRYFLNAEEANEFYRLAKHYWETNRT